MADIPNKPETRKETYLAAIAGQNVDLPPYPITREEAYLDEIAKNGGGGGGGGTSNYNQLSNKPQINSVELSGNKTASQLGLMASDGVVANPTGQTTGTLTALEVGGTKYAVPSGGTSDYTNLTSKPSINGVELSGNKTASQLGMANSNAFQGTIAEWNQLTTAEKKAYDHASISDSIDGGITFPANKVIMTGGGNVEDALTYSTTEHKVGKWIDGCTVYEKVINFGALPNNSTKNVAHGISNLGKVIEISGFARNSSTNTYLPLSTASNNYIIPFANSTDVGITAEADRTAYDECYFYLRYTKNN